MEALRHFFHKTRVGMFHVPLLSVEQYDDSV